MCDKSVVRHYSEIRISKFYLAVSNFNANLFELHIEMIWTRILFTTEPGKPANIPLQVITIVNLGLDLKSAHTPPDNCIGGIVHNS